MKDRGNNKGEKVTKIMQKYIISALVLFAINTNCSAFFCDNFQHEEVWCVTIETSSCQTGMSSCQTGTSVCQTETSSCQTETSSCQTGMSSCQTGTSSCQTGTSSCQTETSSCQTETSSCQTGTSSCQTGTSACQTETSSCQTETSGIPHQVKSCMIKIDLHLKMNDLIKQPICFTEEYCVISSIISQRFRLPLPDV